MRDQEVHAIANGGMATLVALIGRRAKYRIESGLIFAVEIKDVKVGYGKVRVLITPCLGEGYTWVDLASVNLIAPEPISLGKAE